MKEQEPYFQKLMPFQGDYWCLFYVPRASPWAESVLALRAAVDFEAFAGAVPDDREKLFFGPEPSSETPNTAVFFWLPLKGK